MARRRSSGSSTSSLREMRSNLKDTSSYSEFLKESNSQRKKEIRAESTLKYGGGFGRKVLYGMTSSIAGEGAADSISKVFRNRGATEEAYNTLYGDNGVTDKKQTKVLSRIENSVNDNTTNIEDLQEQNTEILNILEDISNKLSPKDITVGKGESAQTFRYDPLAPEGKKVTVVTASGKSGRFASKKESFSVLSKAAYLSNLSGIIPSQPKLERLPRSPDVVRAAIEKARMPMEYVEPEQREPKSYDEYLGAQKNLTKAEKTIRYGGKGIGRKALFGITKAIVGERSALKVATLGRNRKQTEEAFQTIKNRGLPAAETESQLNAEAGAEKRAKTEFSESDKEWKEDVTQRLDRIEKKIGDDGLLSMLSSFLSTAISAVQGVISGLLSAAALAPMIIGALSNPVVLTAFAAAAVGYTIYKGYEKSQEEAKVVDDTTAKIRAGEKVSEEELQAARESEDNFMMWAGTMAGGGMAGAPMMTPQQMGFDSIVDTELKKEAKRKAEIDRKIPKLIRAENELLNDPRFKFDVNKAMKDRTDVPMLPGVTRPSPSTLEDLLIPTDPDVVNQEWQSIPGARRDPETGAIILPDPRSLPTEIEPAGTSSDMKLQKNQSDLENSSEEYSRETSTQPPPIIVAPPAPPPPPAPPLAQSSPGPVVVATRDFDSSVEAFNISRFDSPHSHSFLTA